MAKKVRTNLDFENQNYIVNLPNPVNPQDAATKAYVDKAVEGLNWKDNVRVATQGNINLSAPGATIDGVTLNVGDRVLVRAQTNAAENGIYIFNGASSPMTRAPDANTADELENAVVVVDEGSSAGTTYRQTSVNFVLGTGPVNWSTFGTGAPPASETTAGVIEIATQAEVDAGTDDSRAITPLKLANWAGRIRKYVAIIGDGTSNQFTVTHNFGTQDVVVSVYTVAAPHEEVFVDVEHTSPNAVTIRFGTAPAANSHRVVVIG